MTSLLIKLFNNYLLFVKFYMVSQKLRSLEVSYKTLNMEVRELIVWLIIILVCQDDYYTYHLSSNGECFNDSFGLLLHNLKYNLF